MLQKLTTIQFLREIETDGHRYVIPKISQKIYDFLISPQRLQTIEQVMLKILQK